MAMIILPKNTDPETAAEAQHKFKAAIDDPFTVLMVVYGDSPGTDRILEVCCARASVKAHIRRVVWIPDPTVLSNEQKRKYWKKTYAAVAVGLDDKVASKLTKVEAKGRLYVAEAFASAEGQGGE